MTIDLIWDVKLYNFRSTVCRAVGEVNIQNDQHDNNKRKGVSLNLRVDRDPFLLSTIQNQGNVLVFTALWEVLLDQRPRAHTATIITTTACMCTACPLPPLLFPIVSYVNALRWHEMQRIGPMTPHLHNNILSTSFLRTKTRPGPTLCRKEIWVCCLPLGSWNAKTKTHKKTVRLATVGWEWCNITYEAHFFFSPILCTSVVFLGDRMSFCLWNNSHLMLQSVQYVLLKLVSGNY